MKPNNNRKGFTIVELVIVIAVIAILAAVLIPTFVGLIDAANTSADIQTVKQLNTILTTEKPTSTSELKTVLENNGIEVDNCKPIAKGTYYYYVASENMIVYCDSDNNILYPENTGLTYNALWAPFPLGAGESVAKVNATGATVLSTTANNAETTLVSVSVPQGATSATTLKLVVTDTSGGINLLGTTGNYILGDYSFDISLTDENGNDVTAGDGQSFTVNIQLPTGLNGSTLEVYHEETKMETSSYAYDAETGNLAITTSSFSPYRVFWNESHETEWGKLITSSTFTTTNNEQVTPTYTVELTIPNSGTYSAKYIDFAFVADEDYTGEVKFNVYQVTNDKNEEQWARITGSGCQGKNSFYSYAQAGPKTILYRQRMTVSDFKDATKLAYALKDSNSTAPTGVLEVRLFDTQDAQKYIVVDRISLNNGN